MIEERKYPVECTCGFCAPTAGQENYHKLGMGHCGASVKSDGDFSYRCSREPGHLGEHVACGRNYHPIQDVD